MIRDRYLDLTDVRAALDRVSYKDWQFTAAMHPFEGMTIRIVVPGVVDSYHPDRTIDLGINDWLPPLPDFAALMRWLVWRISRIEIHEVCEAFKVDGVRLYDPHKESA